MGIFLLHFVVFSMFNQHLCILSAAPDYAKYAIYYSEYYLSAGADFANVIRECVLNNYYFVLRCVSFSMLTNFNLLYNSVWRWAVQLKSWL